MTSSIPWSATRDVLSAAIERARDVTRSGVPAQPGNPYFGVGPITDGTHCTAESRQLDDDFANWLEQNYRQYDDRGRDLRGFSVAEIRQCMHRGYPAEKILLDMMRQIHRFFEFPAQNRLGVGLGGGHSGFTSCIMHLMSVRDECRIFIDTPAPESDTAAGSGFFRQSWAEQIIDLQRYSKGGDPGRVHCAASEGGIPDPAWLIENEIRLFVGVGHETTGATAYSTQDVRNLLAWLDADPSNHHAVLDATSLLGAMPWEPVLARAVVERCCLFSPLQKAIGGIAGYFVASFTPEALALIERNQAEPSWAIPRQLRLTAPLDRKRPLSGKASVEVGPFYDARLDKMLGGVINTYSALAFAWTTFGLLRTERQFGSIARLNCASLRNRDLISRWIEANPLFDLVVADPERRGAAVTLIGVRDPDVPEGNVHASILAKAKALIGYEGLTMPDGAHEPGMRAAYYINAFPGTAGDFRAWVGGIRCEADILALLESLKYAWLKAKIAVFEGLLRAESEGQRRGPATQAPLVLAPPR
jgi:phosphoserine aminotransferase